ncbi:hypothetical protein B0H19DRAFT_1089616 [Mycena capillaripes]|nr:hypothetical protein B0H19DRAFT_1089616 [Mycena capillaripes]
MRGRISVRRMTSVCRAGNQGTSGTGATSDSNPSLRNRRDLRWLMCSKVGRSTACTFMDSTEGNPRSTWHTAVMKSGDCSVQA